MIIIFFNKVIEVFLQIVFPNSEQETIITKLDGTFPLHISQTTVTGEQLKREYRVTSLADYTNYKVAALIWSLKYVHNNKAIKIIATVLGDYLLEEVANHKTVYPSHDICILPLPLSKKRKRERGFNQVEILLDKVKAQYIDLAPLVQYNVLEKHKHTKSQTKLQRKERLENIKGAFKVTCKSIGVRGKSVNKVDVILVDDVLTTGATALEAAKTLTQAGVRSVRIVTIARSL